MLLLLLVRREAARFSRPVIHSSQSTWAAGMRCRKVGKKSSLWGLAEMCVCGVGMRALLSLLCKHGSPTACVHRVLLLLSCKAQVELVTSATTHTVLWPTLCGLEQLILARQACQQRLVLQHRGQVHPVLVVLVVLLVIDWHDFLMTLQRI